MANAWYSSGTVSVENGNGVVTGVNTLFTLNAAPGDVFFGPDDKLYQIAAVTDDTHISITTRDGQAAYQGSTLSAQPYAIIRNFTNSVNATLASKLTTLLNNWQTREDQFRTWHGGAANGGPSLDGNYPLTDAVGVSQNIACPAKLQLLAGGQVKAWAKAATTANITLSGNQTVDGVALITGDRCFVKDQSTGSQNGIYVVAAGAWSRASDFDVSADAFPQCLIPIEQGTTNADTIWMMTTNAPLTLGSTALAFTKIYPDPLKANVAGSASQAFSTALLTATGAVINGDTYLKQGTYTLSFYNADKSNWSYIKNTVAAGNTGSDLVFASGGGVAMSILGNKNILIGTTTDNASGGCLQLKSGITFPTTAVTSTDANTLDDYEEGTFTPAIAGITTAGVGTYTTQSGRYTKIGNRVSFSIYLNWTAHTGTGNMQVTGMPFTSSAASGATWAFAGYTSNITSPADTVVKAVMGNGSATIPLYSIPMAGGAAAALAIDASGVIIITGTYEV